MRNKAIIAATAIALGLFLVASASAKVGWTLDHCIDYWGSPTRTYLKHATVADLDYGVCLVLVYNEGYDGAIWIGHEIYVLRHDFTIGSQTIKADTVCMQLDAFSDVSMLSGLGFKTVTLPQHAN
jgi:hypothetical protein